MSNVDQRGLAKYSYLTLSQSQIDSIVQRCASVSDIDALEEFTHEQMLLNVFYNTIDSGAYRRKCKTVLRGAFLDNLSDNRPIREYFSRPRRHIADKDLGKLFAQHELKHYCGGIVVRDNFHKFRLSLQNPKGRPVYISFSCVYPKTLNPDVNLFQHLIEMEVIEEYSAYTLRSLVESSIELERRPFTDPMQALEVFISQQTKKVPEFGVVVWVYSDELEALVTELSTLKSFNYDLFDHEGPLWSPVWRAYKGGEEVFVKNVRKDELIGLPQNREIRAQLDDLGVRSMLLVPLIVRGLTRGVIGFFSRNYGDVLNIFHPYLEFLVQQSVRHIAESDHVAGYITLNQKLKELTPLLAIGREVVERMHDVRDDINKLSNIFLKIENKKKYPDRNELVRFAADGASVVDGIKRTLSKQLQTFRSARETKKTVVLQEFVKKMVDRYKVEANLEGVNVEICGERESMRVRLQEFYFMRVLENLIMNGVYFSKQRVDVRAPFVKVIVERVGSLASICVLDSGPGVRQRPVEVIFDAGETTKPDGFGVGLAIVKQVVSEHGGRIEVQNEARFGARFTIYLPCLNDE